LVVISVWIGVYCVGVHYLVYVMYDVGSLVGSLSVVLGRFFGFFFIQPGVFPARRLGNQKNSFLDDLPVQANSKRGAVYGLKNDVDN
ncbi:hypothetical protein NQU36_26920, partial [Escherichia coli]|uniref:hypothetical protein n=1 Tax=Escherichia coli TaxID=562 RepID=UPI0021190B82